MMMTRRIVGMGIKHFEEYYVEPKYEMVAMKWLFCYFPILMGPSRTFFPSVVTGDHHHGDLAVRTTTDGRPYGRFTVLPRHESPPAGEGEKKRFGLFHHQLNKRWMNGVPGQHKHCLFTSSASINGAKVPGTTITILILIKMGGK